MDDGDGGEKACSDLKGLEVDDGNGEDGIMVWWRG